MSEYIHKSHNVSRLMYHIVFPAKYRKLIIDEQVDRVIKETCIEISKRYLINFLEIGTDKDHIHFPVLISLILHIICYCVLISMLTYCCHIIPI